MAITRKKIKIGYIKREQKIAKSGKNKGGEYTAISIKPEGNDTWINGFGCKSNEGWQKGDEIEVDIEDREYEGKTYYNIKNPSNKVSADDFKALNDRVVTLELELSNIKAKLGLSNGKTGIAEPSEVGENLPV